MVPCTHPQSRQGCETAPGGLVASRNPKSLGSTLPIVMALTLLSPPAAARAQLPVDPALAREIASIRAFDNHAHPLRALIDGESDNEWDALVSEEPLPEFPLPVGLRPDNPQNIAAWTALYGYQHSDMSQEHLAELLETKRRIMREKGNGYAAWVLDQLGIETMVANRTVMGRGLDPPRFRWASFVDALMLPLSNQRVRAKHPEYRSFYAGVEKWRERYLSEANVRSLPAKLDDYLAKVIVGTLERQKRDGAIAIKFEASYLRSLEFTDAPPAAAARTYARYAAGGEPPASEYKLLQDFLFRAIAREAGRLGLVVHIHVGAGAGSFYELGGSNPILLESVLNDPSLRATRFVLIHGGWPFYKETAFLLGKPNVYADFSAMTFLVSPRALAEVLRTWLEWYPEKVLFGTDGFALTPEFGWEEVSWLSNRTGRDALGHALTTMLNDGIVTRERALELARMTMRENGLRLYGLR